MITENDVEWSWFIRKVNVIKSDGELNDIIKSISWTLEVEYIDSDKEHYVRDYSKITELSQVTNTSNFIKYDNLQKDDLISWIIENEGDEVISEYRKKLIRRLNEEIGNSTEEKFFNKTTRVINFD